MNKCLESVDYYYNKIVVEKPRQKHDFDNLIKSGKSEILYHIKHPEQNRILSIIDKVYYLKEMDIYIGIVIENRKERQQKES